MNLSPQLLLCIAFILAGIGLFHFQTSLVRKLGLLSFWLATGTAAWAISGMRWVGGVALLLWIVFPLSEIIVGLRRLRIPRKRLLQETFPPLDDFPDLRPLTQEMEALGFEKVEDCHVMPPVQEQFYRLFGHKNGFHHAMIGFVSHGGIGFDFVAFSSEDKEGQSWVTWDYPLSYGLKMPPQVILHRATECATLQELWEEHGELLRVNAITEANLVAGADQDAVRNRLEKTLARQLQYNITIGILSAKGSQEEGDLRYSWRGAFYVASEVVRDLVRL